MVMFKSYVNVYQRIINSEKKHKNYPNMAMAMAEGIQFLRISSVICPYRRADRQLVTSKKGTQDPGWLEVITWAHHTRQLNMAHRKSEFFQLQKWWIFSQYNN